MNRRFEGTTSHNYRSFETAGTSIFDSQVESSCIFLLLLDIVFANIIKRGSDNRRNIKRTNINVSTCPGALPRSLEKRRIQEKRNDVEDARKHLHRLRSCRPKSSQAERRRSSYGMRCVYHSATAAFVVHPNVTNNDANEYMN